MRIVTLLLALAASLALAAFVYQQAVVEGAFGPAAMFGTAVLGVLVVGLILLAYLSGTRHRELVGKLILACTAVVVSYLVLDIAAGWILIAPLSPPLVPDAYRHHAMVPDSHAEIRQRDFAYIQRVNHLGLRGRETTVEKPAGTRRILMLGDSFTMGKGVEEDQTFSVLVERGFRHRWQVAAAVRWRCSTGASTATRRSSLPSIRARSGAARARPGGPQLRQQRPDSGGGLPAAGGSRSGGRIIAVPQVWHHSAYERFLSWTSRHLFFTRVLLVYVNRAMDHRELTVRSVVNEVGREHFAHTLEGDVNRTAQWDDVFESIGRIKQLADSIGAEFVLSTYPWAHQLGDNGWVPGRYDFMKKGERTTDVTQRTMRERSAALGISLFEALPVFPAVPGLGAPLFRLRSALDAHRAAGHGRGAAGLHRGASSSALVRSTVSRPSITSQRPASFRSRARHEGNAARRGGSDGTGQ